MKLISWNVNGIRAVTQKNFFADIESLAPDILCLQETKAQEHQVEESLAPLKDKYHIYSNSAERKGYSGTAILTRTAPISVSYDIGKPEHDQEGRVICAEYDSFYLVNVYTPNAQEGLARIEYRMSWEDDFRENL